MVLTHALYLVAAYPAYFVFSVATDLTEESRLDPATFWASFGWLVSLIGGWAVFAWFHRRGDDRSGAWMFLGIFAVWAFTSMMVVSTL